MSRCSFIGETSTSDCPAPVSASWRRLSTAGAPDLVIGSHPHVVQPAETIEDSAGNVRGATVYSMGNFVSNQRFPDTDGGLSVRVTLTLDEQGRTSCLPEYLIVWTCISRDPNSASGPSLRYRAELLARNGRARASRRFRPVRRAYAPAPWSVTAAALRRYDATTDAPFFANRRPWNAGCRFRFGGG